MKYVREKILIYCIAAGIICALASCDEEEIVIASFTASETEIETGVTVSFTNESENAYYYQWDFGDGDISFDTNPSHEYSVAGSYDVTLVAIGNENSDSTTISLEVVASYDVTIFEGVGIENVDVYDTWAQIQVEYPSIDTIHYIYNDYLEDYGIYYHEIYFYEEGVIFDFLTTSKTVESNDPVYYIWVLYPYQGATNKGIEIGSTMDDVVEQYGDPLSEESSNGYTSYWYDTKGIDFYDDGDGVVQAMCVYESYESSSASTTKSAGRRMIIDRNFFNHRNKIK